MNKILSERGEEALGDWPGAKTQMKMMKKAMLFTLCLSMFLLAACSSEKKENQAEGTGEALVEESSISSPQVKDEGTQDEGTGEPFIVKVGGLDIIPGATALQAIEDGGYLISDTSGQAAIETEEGNLEFAYAHFTDLTVMAETNTIYVGIVMVKDGQCMASFTIENDSMEEIPLGECIITNVSVAHSDFENESSLLGGISFTDLSLEKLTEVFGEPVSGSEEEGFFTWKNGGYQLELYLNENGEVEYYSSSY